MPGDHGMSKPKADKLLEITDFLALLTIVF